MIALSVTEASQIAEARRTSVARAEQAGFGVTEAGRVAIVATELATNLVKHGGGGEILVRTYEDSTGTGIELLALDRGPGMADIQACLEDGYSTAGSSGHGLGAIRRQSHVMDVASWPGLGTAILARLEASRLPARPSEIMPAVGVVSLPKPGEDVCGDAWSADERGGRYLVADGLGHGPEAAEASLAAVRVFRRHPDQPLEIVLRTVHEALRPTRGAAVALTQIDPERDRVSFVGVGNIAGAVVGGASVRRMLSHNGTAGHNARKIQVFEYELGDGLVIMHSDGLGTNWSFDRYPGLAARHPSLVAAVLYRDFARGRDDVTVLVARRRAP